MILTCPSCATQYSVDAARMDRPRQVRCSACKTAWMAKPADEVEELPAASQLLGEDTPLYRAEAGPAAADTTEPAAESQPVAKLIREKTKAKQQTRKAMAAGVVWGGLAAGMILVLGVAALLRVEVVRLIPSTAGAYAKVGLPVNPVGLAPEGVEAGPGLHNGHAAVIVTGRLRNVQTRAHPPAPLRIILMDKGGHRLTDQVLRAGEHPLQPGEARPFQLAFLDPPSGVAQVQVEFAFDAMKPHQAAKPSHGEAHGPQGHEAAKDHGEPAHPPAAHAEPHAEAHGQAHNEKPLGLRGSAAPSPVAPIPAKVAQPLSEDSPYALPEAARKHAGHG
jgi:predicted Zn finger-like uncharacterized protein